MVALERLYSKSNPAYSVVKEWFAIFRRNCTEEPTLRKEEAITPETIAKIVLDDYKIIERVHWHLKGKKWVRCR